MADYKSMYFYLAGRMASAVDTLETTTDILQATTVAMQTTTGALIALKEKLKNAQRETEEMFISADDDESDDKTGS